MSKKLRIVIAEDNEALRTLLELQLMGLRKVEFIEARDGIEALHLCRTQNVDLLITDLDMPRMNGVTLIKAIRSDQETRISKIPILIITGGSVELQVEALGAGGDLLLMKPLRRRALVDCIISLLP